MPMTSVQYRLHITSPEQYEALKLGQIESKDIYVESTAHAQILLEPKQFWNASFETIHFADNHGNAITISPKSRRVHAALALGENLTLGFPDNYREYHVTYYDNLYATEADIDYMLTWKNSIRIEMFDVNNTIPRMLLERINEMKDMQHLERLAFNINRNQFLDVRPFLKELPTLQSISFYGASMSDEELEEFIYRQDITDLIEWDGYCIYGHREVYYSKWAL